LAELLGSKEPTRVKGDLLETAVTGRSTMLVSKRLPHFSLLSAVSPTDFEPSAVGSVVAAVAGGPHSRIAALVARRLGEVLGVRASMACAHRSADSSERAVAVVESLFPHVPDLEYRVIAADNPARLISQLPPRCLLVIGAPGGNWLQRVLFGPGARLRQRADGGTVIVRSAVARVFQVMGEPHFVSPYHQAADVLRLHSQETLAVAENGSLVGVVRRASLASAEKGRPVSQVMENPRSIGQDRPVSDLAGLAGWFGDSPVPVVDSMDRLVGSVTGFQDSTAGSEIP
jgi:hypothetical protein